MQTANRTALDPRLRPILTVYGDVVASRGRINKCHVLEKLLRWIRW